MIPPALTGKWQESLVRDFRKIVDGEAEFRNLRALRHIPIGGEIYYHLFGAGAESARKRGVKGIGVTP